ncbi:hypothetical protein BVG19_g4104 [[Candida] boidinii]|nr:hypothetical protein BVG19_g4104 [[Candida] boidinii]OWB52961.1 hypothetical protein B5S27_g4546 [[Candida] boidinii]OWB86407.1 hypothetical protein B5S33_g5099 [[Candida] boidinii]
MNLGTICCFLASTFPKALCTALYLWAYWTITFKVCFTSIPIIPSLILFIVMTVLAGLGMISYYLVVAVGPGSPLDFPSLCVTSTDINDDANINLMSSSSDSPVHTNEATGNLRPPEILVSKSVLVKENGGFRFCNSCKCWKPDRCHHCSACNKCILKMDHHCPWFSECIGFKNLKFFFQFLVYTVIYTFSCSIISGYVLYHFFFLEDIKLKFFSLNVLFVFFIGLVMFLAVVVFTGFSLFLLLKNRTTIESYKFNRIRPSKYGDHRGGDDAFHRNDAGDSIFDLGYKRNWQVVMGTTLIEWLLPIRFTVPKDEDGYVYGDGLSFEVNKAVFNQLKSHNELQQRLSTELGNFRAKQKAIQEQNVQDLISSY